MKKNNCLLLILLFVGLLSCKEDEVKPDPFANVPSAEIVPVGDRNEMLTGSTSLEGGTQRIVKWWEYKSENADNTCEDVDDNSLLSLNYQHLSFRLDGSIYTREGTSGNGYVTETHWRWEDDNKSAIILDDSPGERLIIRALNPTEIIFASQKRSGECTAIAWKEYDKPIVEKIGSTDGLAETGYIVPIGERDEMLHGTASSTKWWEALGLNIYYNCEEYEDEEFRGGDRYMAFKSNGIFYSKEGKLGDEIISGTWEWTDSHKTAIYINDVTDEVMTITALNEEQFIVRGEKEYMNCAATIIEIFGNPILQ